jgi:hypothetical protein
MRKPPGGAGKLYTKSRAPVILAKLLVVNAIGLIFRPLGRAAVSPGQARLGQMAIWSSGWLLFAGAKLWRRASYKDIIRDIIGRD